MTTLLDELKAARDADLAPLADLGDDSLVAAAAGPAWGEAISIVERWLKPMEDLDADALTGLRDNMPCLPGERHTFDAGALVCLCGALQVGLAQPHPSVCLYSPADGHAGHPDPLTGPAREVRG